MSRRPPKPTSRHGRDGGRDGGRGAGRGRSARQAAAETLEVVVEKLGAQGDGLAAWTGQTLYIPGALPGERVRIKTGPRRADGIACALVEVVAPAPGRITPPCPHFSRCGGCALQHLDADLYAQWKRERVVDALAKRGFAEAPVLPPVLIPAGTRRRVTFTAEHASRTVRLGFNARMSHDLVAVDACLLLTAPLDALIAPLQGLMAQVLADRQSAQLRVTWCDNGADILIEADTPPTLAAREAIAAFSAHGHAVRVGWKEPGLAPEPVAQAVPPVAAISGVEVELPMGAFLQPSLAGEEALRQQMLAGVEGAARIADLYCGLGTFTLALARQGVVRAVDAMEAPVRALERAAGRAGLGGRILAEVRDLDRNPLEPKELAKFDAVVFDPPRAGAALQAAHIAKSKVARVVAVSCNPATFARDARILVDGGYRLVDVLPVDQFTFSPHVEVVARFARAG